MLRSENMCNIIERWNLFDNAHKESYISWIKSNILINRAIISSHEVEKTSTSITDNVPKFTIGEEISSKIKGTPSFYCCICQQDVDVKHPVQIDIDILSHVLDVHAAGDYDLIEEPLVPSLNLPDYQKEQLITIHSCMISGNRREAVDLITKYGMYDFFSDYAKFLRASFPQEEQYNFFLDITTSFMRITNR